MATDILKLNVMRKIYRNTQTPTTVLVLLALLARALSDVSLIHVVVKGNPGGPSPPEARGMRRPVFGCFINALTG